MKTYKKGCWFLDRFSDVVFYALWVDFGVRNGGKSPKICPKGGPKTKTAIFRKSCSRVHGSTIFEVRRPRKLSRNLRKTVTERRRKPKRVSGVHFHDFGAVLDLKKDPKIIKKRSKNDTEKQTRKKALKISLWRPKTPKDYHFLDGPAKCAGPPGEI